MPITIEQKGIQIQKVFHNCPHLLAKQIYILEMAQSSAVAVSFKVTTFGYLERFFTAGSNFLNIANWHSRLCFKFCNVLFKKAPSMCLCVNLEQAFLIHSANNTLTHSDNCSSCAVTTTTTEYHCVCRFFITSSK